MTVYEGALLREPPPYHRAFCRTCGSPLPVRIEGTGFVALHAGVLDGDPAVRPFRHVFVSQQVAWCPIGDDLPQLPSHVPRDQRLPRPGG